MKLLVYIYQGIKSNNFINYFFTLCFVSCFYFENYLFLFSLIKAI